MKRMDFTEMPPICPKWPQAEYPTQGPNTSRLPYRRARLARQTDDNGNHTGLYTITFIGARFGDVSKSYRFAWVTDAADFIELYKKHYRIRVFNLERLVEG